MAFIIDLSASLTQIQSSATAHGSRAGAPDWRKRLAEVDLAFVHRCTSATRYTPLKWLAIIISKLGNGWIYLILTAIILLQAHRDAQIILLTSTINAAVLHVIYPMLKRAFRRRRPFRVDPRLRSLLCTLDEYSFPSGHVMTLSGVLVPVILLVPESRVPALGLILAMAWSRIATAHHFPSDVVAGATLGTTIAFPCTFLVMQLA